MDLQQLNQFSLESVTSFQNIQAFGTAANTPYYINNIEYYINELLQKAQVTQDKITQINNDYQNRGVLYGWYLGKGNPQQITESVIKMTQQIGFDSTGMTSYGLASLLNFFGLGVDCSGFVYQVMLHAFTEIDKREEFINSLNWTDPTQKGPNYAGVSVFTGSASTEIAPHDARAMDIVVLGTDGDFDHIGMFVEEDGQLMLAQSNINTEPTGPGLTQVDKTTTGLDFKLQQTFGESWNSLLNQELLQVRRLTISNV